VCVLASVTIARKYGKDFTGTNKFGRYCREIPGKAVDNVRGMATNQKAESRFQIVQYVEEFRAQFLLVLLSITTFQILNDRSSKRIRLSIVKDCIGEGLDSHI
jgi:hypothetical protein